MTSTGVRDSPTDGGSGGASSLSALRRFTRQREPAERCELCQAPIPAHPRHEHLLDPAARMLACACTPCALLFPADALKRYRRVSRRLWLLEGFQLTDAQWDSLAIPVNMAFLYTSAPSGEVHAFYPSPAGATASTLSLQGWDELVEGNPVIADMQPDVEALLVNRVHGAAEYYVAPIDRCYELVGLIRVGWRGLSGGSELWEQIEGYFRQLRDWATPRRADGGA